MKRIYNQDDVWYFDKYFAYLNKNIKKIPSNIQKIILNEEKYTQAEKEEYKPII